MGFNSFQCVFWSKSVVVVSCWSCGWVGCLDLGSYFCRTLDLLRWIPSFKSPCKMWVLAHRPLKRLCWNQVVPYWLDPLRICWFSISVAVKVPQEKELIKEQLTVTLPKDYTNATLSVVAYFCSWACLIAPWMPFGLCLQCFCRHIRKTRDADAMYLPGLIGQMFLGAIWSWW